MSHLSHAAGWADNHAWNNTSNLIQPGADTRRSFHGGLQATGGTEVNPTCFEIRRAEHKAARSSAGAERGAGTPPGRGQTSGTVRWGEILLINTSPQVSGARPAAPAALSGDRRVEEAAVPRPPELGVRGSPDMAAGAGGGRGGDAAAAAAGGSQQPQRCPQWRADKGAPRQPAPAAPGGWVGARGGSGHGAGERSDTRGLARPVPGRATPQAGPPAPALRRPCGSAAEPGWGAGRRPRSEAPAWRRFPPGPGFAPGGAGPAAGPGVAPRGGGAGPGLGPGRGRCGGAGPAAGGAVIAQLPQPVSLLLLVENKEDQLRGCNYRRALPAVGTARSPSPREECSPQLIWGGLGPRSAKEHNARLKISRFSALNKL